MAKKNISDFPPFRMMFIFVTDFVIFLKTSKYNGLEVENDSIEYNHFLQFYQDYSDSLTPYRTEMLVFHEELKLSGSIDMLFKLKDGKKEILFKVEIMKF